MLLSIYQTTEFKKDADEIRKVSGVKWKSIEKYRGTYSSCLLKITDVKTLGDYKFTVQTLMVDTGHCNNHLYYKYARAKKTH